MITIIDLLNQSIDVYADSYVAAKALNITRGSLSSMLSKKSLVYYKHYFIGKAIMHQSQSQPMSHAFKRK